MMIPTTALFAFASMPDREADSCAEFNYRCGNLRGGYDLLRMGKSQAISADSSLVQVGSGMLRLLLTL
jgi:hypothetical protein